MDETIHFPAWFVVSAHSQPGKDVQLHEVFVTLADALSLQMTLLSVFKFRITTLVSSVAEHIPVAPETVMYLIPCPRSYLAFRLAPHKAKSSDLIIRLGALPSITRNVYRHSQARSSLCGPLRRHSLSRSMEDAEIHYLIWRD
jgi:hypothetical protein